MKRIIGWTGAVTLAIVAGGCLSALPGRAAAQDVGLRTECRCVDGAGNEIENCSCVRAPEARGLMTRLFSGADRPRVGITLDPTQPPEVDARGARVEDLLEDGPAAEAGLRAGDVVVSFDGHDLLQALDPEVERDFDLDQSVPVQRLLALARRLEPGQEVDVVYLRDGERRTATLEARNLGRWGVRAFALPDMEALGRRFEIHGPDGQRARVFVSGDGRFDRCPERPGTGDGPAALVFGDACPGGLRLVALNPGLGEYFGTDEGVLVADVHPDSPLGLRPGDVIQRIGARDADTPDRVGRILRSYEEDEAIPFHIVRDGRPMDVQGRLTP